jgi:hypothetical protein
MILDRDKPFSHYIYYKRLNPRTTGGTGVGFGSTHQYHFTDVQKTEYVKKRVYRYESLDKIKQAEQKLLNGFCYKCGDVKNCLKLKFINSLYK